MLKCSKCGGYGKTVSTKNVENGVMRYHKCEDCGETFTSMQQATNLVNECDIAKNKKSMIDIFRSEKFRYEIKPLFDYFCLLPCSFYCESTEDDFLFDNVDVLSTVFEDGETGLDSKFLVKVSIYKDELNGVIHLVHVLDDGTLESQGVVGTIHLLRTTTKFGDMWKTQLDRAVIHELKRPLAESKKHEFY